MIGLLQKLLMCSYRNILRVAVSFLSLGWEVGTIVRFHGFPSRRKIMKNHEDSWIFMQKCWIFVMLADFPATAGKAGVHP